MVVRIKDLAEIMFFNEKDREEGGREERREGGRDKLILLSSDTTYKKLRLK